MQIFIVGVLQENECSHDPAFADFVIWCDESYLQLIILKNKHITDFRKSTHTQKVTFIRGHIVECFQGFKYLGIVNDSKLNFKANRDAVCSKVASDPCLRVFSFPHCQNHYDFILFILSLN